MAFLTLVGSYSYSAWQDHQVEVACQPYTAKTRSLDHKASAIEIPLVSPSNPYVAALGSVPRTFSRFVPEPSNASPDDITSAYREKRELVGQSAQVVLQHESCFSEAEVDRATRVKDLPTEVVSVNMPSPARCADGWPSGSIGRQGACSHHGGVVPAQIWAVLHF